MDSIKGGIYVYVNDIEKIVYVGQTKNFENRKYQHKHGSHRDDLYEFIIDLDTNYKEVYIFENLTEDDRNDLSIMEDYICRQYKKLAYKVLNKSPMNIDIKGTINERFAKVGCKQRFVVIDDNELENIRLTMSKLREYIVNNIIKHGGVVRNTDIKAIIDIINRNEHLYNYWEEYFTYAELQTNHNFRKIFWDLGIEISTNYDPIKKKIDFIIEGFGYHIDRCDNDYSFIINMLESERMKEYYCILIYDVKSINIDYYMENKKSKLLV